MALGLEVKRTLGMGDTIFALAAVHAYKQARPKTTVWFRASHPLQPLVECSGDVTLLPTRAPEGRTIIDLDTIPTDTDECRYHRMAAELGVAPIDLTVPWQFPKHIEERVRQDFPQISNAVVFTPWCGGFAPTRSIPDRVIREFIEYCPHALLLRHVEKKAGFERVPNNICGWHFGEIYLAVLLKQAKAVVSVDSGPAYLAISVGTPTVVAFTHIAARSRLGAADIEKSTVEVWEPQLDCVPCGDFPDPANPPCSANGSGRAACAKSICVDDLLERLHKVVNYLRLKPEACHSQEA